MVVNAAQAHRPNTGTGLIGMKRHQRSASDSARPVLLIGLMTERWAAYKYDKSKATSAAAHRPLVPDFASSSSDGYSGLKPADAISGDPHNLEICKGVVPLSVPRYPTLASYSATHLHATPSIHTRRFLAHKTVQTGVIWW